MTDELIADRCRELAALINRHTDGGGMVFTIRGSRRSDLAVSL